MSDTAPGRITEADSWPGRWETITREDCAATIEEAGGYEALAVASACTRVDEGYFLTAWARKGDDCPLVQNVLEGCDQSVPPAEVERCPGVHTFQKFIFDPALEDDDD